jgi:hypothetical protein
VSSELDDAKQTILRVLRGELTEKAQPALFDDDVFFLLVRDVEAKDPTWLMAMLRDRTYSRDARGLVALNMTHEGHGALIVELFAERAPN